jgi:dynein heavy chain
LQRVLAVQLGEHLDAVTRVSERAGKEHQIEVALDKMEAEWRGVPLTLLPYRDTGTFLLRGVDALQALLDEHTQTTQAVSFSAFKKPFAERIDAWAATLSTASEVLDEWLRLQRAFLYLQPIFASEDIQRQLPVEYKRFASADKTWRSTMAAAKGPPLPPAAAPAAPPAAGGAGAPPAASAAASSAAALASAATQPVDGVAALAMCANA